jgi:hypothetical protein
MSKVIFTVYAPLELKLEIEQLAKESERTTNGMVSHLLDLGVEEYKKRELEKFND